MDLIWTFKVQIHQKYSFLGVVSANLRAFRKFLIESTLKFVTSDPKNLYQIWWWSEIWQPKPYIDWGNITSLFFTSKSNHDLPMPTEIHFTKSFSKTPSWIGELKIILENVYKYITSSLIGNIIEKQTYDLWNRNPYSVLIQKSSEFL